MLEKNGFLLVKDFCVKEIIHIKKEMENCFELICKRKYKDIDKDIICLFKEDISKFLGWTNICQNLLSVHRFANSKKIENLLISKGLRRPVLNTRPLLSLSCKSIAKHESYWKVPEHQDWPSTRGSLNGVTIWTPLISLSNSLGPLEILKYSHLEGLLNHDSDGLVPVIDSEILSKFVSKKMKIGDVLIFNYFTVHRSGTNLHDNKIRWSLHFRYDDATEKTFIERKYPRYKKEIRSDEDLDYSFPTKDQIKNAIFNKTKKS